MAAPSAEELAMEYNGKALADLPAPPDPKHPKAPPTVQVKAGEQLPGFGVLRDDGTTACGCWIFSGAWTQAGNQMARRDNSDPWGIGQTVNWAWSWPANRRILYNAASSAPDGKPWSANHKLVQWNGTAWTGADVPDIRPDANPAEPTRVQPFIMTAEGVARMFVPPGLVEGPLPEHYSKVGPLEVNEDDAGDARKPATDEKLTSHV